jgi:hypothetical protein
MRALQRSMRNSGFIDIGYSFAADLSGGAFEARGIGRDSAATGGRNGISHAVVAMGNFEVQQPTPQLETAIVDIVRFLFNSGAIRSPRISGDHSQAPGNATACAGRNLRARIPDLNRRLAGGQPGPAPPPPVPEPPRWERGAMDIVASPRGGYYVVAGDGGVFAYGGAPFFGSMGGQQLSAPVVGMAVRPQGDGYWLCAADGGVFAFGAAPFRGSMGGHRLNAPVISMSTDQSGGGYWLLARDGGIFTFGLRFHGAPTGLIRP